MKNKFWTKIPQNGHCGVLQLLWKALHTSAITETSTISCSITLHGFEFFYSQLKKLSFVKKICKRWIVVGYEKKINVGYYK